MENYGGEDENWSFQPQLDSPRRFGVRSARGAHGKQIISNRSRQLSTSVWWRSTADTRIRL